jgi:hypothetical protein
MPLGSLNLDPSLVSSLVTVAFIKGSNDLTEKLVEYTSLEM